MIKGIYADYVMEFRAAADRKGMTAVQLARLAGVKPYVVDFARGGRIGNLETVNRLRAAVMLSPLNEAVFRAQYSPVSRAVKTQLRKLVVETPAKPVAPPIATEVETVPACDWANVAAAARELGEAAADFQFTADLHRAAELRLRAAQRRALAAGIAVAPALIAGPAETSSPASKRTTQFFKLLSLGGAIPQ